MLQLEIIGNLGRDAEIRSFGEKKYVALSVAHPQKGKDGTQDTIWVDALWRGEGGGLLQYLTRGAKVFVRGRLAPKAYTDRDSNPRFSISVYANEVTLCGGKPDKTTTQQPDGGDDIPF